MTMIRFGFSPCPNDTFAFHALVHGKVAAPCTIEPVMADIDELNTRAHRGDLELTKMSVGALAACNGRYVPLRSGAALGFGVGPLVVAQSERSLHELASSRIAIPGRTTTAFMLLEQSLDISDATLVEMRYDLILEAAASGAVDAGLIIHESRFTYQHHGLVKVADLGDIWESRTGLPVPLAVICARVDMDSVLRDELESSLRQSVAHAFAHPRDSADFVRAHAQEMDADVCRQHIELYVNSHSLDIGDAGFAAIEALVSASAPQQ